MNKLIYIPAPSYEEIKRIAQDLRQQTGRSLMDCKVALQNSRYDIEKAKIYLENYPKCRI